MKNLYRKTTYRSIPAYAYILIAFIFGCSKNNSNPNPTPVLPSLTITSLDIDSGSYNARVTITGTGFSLTPAEDIISFNGKTAVAETASLTQLITTVPLSAGTGKITITVGGKTTTGPIFKYIPVLMVTTLAGSTDPGSTNGAGSAAKFYQPHGIVVDETGNLYVADLRNNLIRKITAEGTVSTFAGSGTAGTADGTGTAASFNGPAALLRDAAGNLYVYDSGSGLIRKITSSGIVTTLAGNNSGFAVDGKGTAGSFGNIVDWTSDGKGNIFAIDNGHGNRLLRKMTLAGSITTVFDISSYNLDPRGIALDKVGNFILADDELNQIVKMSIIGGSYTSLAGVQSYANSTEREGYGTAASFVDPGYLTTDKDGNIYMCDLFTLRKVTPEGFATIIGGNNQLNYNGPVATATFNSKIGGITVDLSGNIYITDDNQVRKISFQ